MKLIIVAVVLSCLLSAPSTFGQEATGKAVAQSGFEGTVEQALVYAATTFNSPLVAEIVENENLHIRIPAGEITLSSMLSDVTGQNGISWADMDGVAYVYDEGLKKNESSLMNYTFAWFKVPSHPSEFKYFLENRINAEIDLDPHRNGLIGGAYSGIVSTELDAHLCSSGELREVSVRDLLLKEAKAADLISVVIYPFRDGKFSKDVTQDVISKWIWKSADTRLLPKNSPR